MHKWTDLEILGSPPKRAEREIIMKKINLVVNVEVEDDVDVEDFVLVQVADHFDVYMDDIKWGVVFDTPPTEEDIKSTNVQYKGYDIIWNPNMHGGEYEVFKVMSDHTQYTPYRKLQDAIDYIEHKVRVQMLFEKYRDNYDFSDTAMYMADVISNTTTDTIEEIYKAEYDREIDYDDDNYDNYEDEDWTVVNDAFWMMISSQF